MENKMLRETNIPWETKTQEILVPEETDTRGD